MRVSDYDLLFDLPAGEYEGSGVEGVRTTTIRAGRSLEVMIAPRFRWTPEARREAKARRSSPAMARINQRNTERLMMRLMEHNFTTEAVVFTLTYAYPVEEYGMCNLAELSDSYERRGLPWDAERVNKDRRNFLEKAKRRTKAAGGKAEGLKWITCTEEGKEPPVPGLPPKYHIHGIMEGSGITVETVEAIWPHGAVRAERFRLNDDGPAQLARYFCKQKRGGRSWSHSRNLKHPEPRVSERKVSRRRLAKLAQDIQRDGREILEKLYPGYKVVELPDVRFSDFAPGAYIYARLRRDDKDSTAPPWERFKRQRRGMRS